MSETRYLALVLHDVAPATWPAYAGFVAEVDARFGIPLNLLVVPDYHRQGSLDRQADFVRTLDARLARGDELILHGYYHDDPGPIPPSPKQYLLRRVLTHEGEFLPLSRDEARLRLERGLSLFQRLGWPAHGFVPPAWLLGRPAREALADLPLSYTSNPQALFRLPAFQAVKAPSLVWSSRSGWRRFLSRIWNTRRLRRAGPAGLLRLGVHPVDLAHPAARQFWLRVLETLLPQRTAITKHAWLERQG